MGFDVKRFVTAKVNIIKDTALLEKFKKATEKKHKHGFMTTEIFEYTMERIEQRMKELQVHDLTPDP